MVLLGGKMLAGVSRNNRDGRTTAGGGGGPLTFGGVEILAWLWILSALATALAVPEHQRSYFYTHGRYGKRQEPHNPVAAMPFFSGSRYGRSGTTSARAPKSLPKLLEVSPRVDRFFLGSRYGKRAPTNNNSNDNQQQELERLSRISSPRRFDEAIGYLDRVQRADNFVGANDIAYDENNTRGNGIYKGNEEAIPIDIPNDDEIENFW